MPNNKSMKENPNPMGRFCDEVPSTTSKNVIGIRLKFS
jgi:hypothetical protein